MAEPKARSFCGECGTAIDEPPNIAPENRLPCPFCGSKSRHFHLTVMTPIAASSYASALGTREGEAVSFSESPRNGLVSNALLGKDGLVHQGLAGRSPQGEEDTLLTCRLLMEHLNVSGGNWRLAEGRTEPADCLLVDAHDERIILEVQVTRAVASPSLWKRLSHEGSVQSTLDEAEAAEEIRDAIETKCRRIPEAIRSKLVLALDATRLPGLAFDSSVRMFRRKWAHWAASQGFASIWLVGPVSNLVWRLDSTS